MMLVTFSFWASAPVAWWELHSLLPRVGSLAASSFGPVVLLRVVRPTSQTAAVTTIGIRPELLRRVLSFMIVAVSFSHVYLPWVAVWFLNSRLLL